MYIVTIAGLSTLFAVALQAGGGIRELGSSRMVGSALGTIVCLLALIARQIHDKAAKAEFMFAAGFFAASPRVPPLLACRRAPAARMVKVAEAK
jgi:hypothetical protein